MKTTLPIQTEPYQSRISRLHTPTAGEAKGAYSKFRPCLRWEFGFTCAFCLLHESDVADYGVARTGLFWIEHVLTQSSKAGAPQKNLYGNVVYACKWCNRSRGTAPLTDAEGRTLQDPTRVVWRALFQLESDELVPREGSPDAFYTWETYELGDSLKTELRSKRRKELGRARLHLKRCPKYIQRIEEQLSAGGHSAEELAELQDELALHRDLLDEAKAVLKRRRAIPLDSDSKCVCPQKDSLDLPSALKVQLSSGEEGTPAA